MTQDNDPWGDNPRNTETNDLGAVLHKIKDSLFGSGGGNSDGDGPKPGQSMSKMPKLSGKAVVPIATVAALVWISTGIYILPEGSHGVELTFGEYSETATQAGFNLRWPFPIGSVNKVDVENVKTLSVGSSNGNTEGQMLTSDENIVEISLSVQYKIRNAEAYLFNVNNPEQVLKEALISSIREVVGSSNVDYVLTDGRGEWPAKVQKNLINTLKGFEVGFDILRVKLRNAKAPKEVQAAFDDAVKAREDRDRYKLQAEAYRNKTIPLARGQAKAITEQAEGYKASTIARATGEANRFKDILATYRLAPKVTRDRMYLETLQSVYTSVNNVVVATGKNTPVMYLPMGQGQPPQVLPATPQQMSDKQLKVESKEDEFKISKPQETKRLTR
ncbi:MAG: FtsH protease activity modulator HflK [Gammaproteobacteria bacterium]|nr:MAG: FtsH protease activity modulator HflK [Gammaproteobacteria bacterium]